MTGKVQRFRALLARFAEARRGATALEFALIATPFLALLFGILELGLIFMVQTTLDNAVDRASRTIRTGELQTSGGTASSFKTAVCTEMSWLGSNCSSNVYVDVRTFTTFANVSITDPTTNGVFDSTKTQFNAGGSENIVLVRVYYTWNLVAPTLNQGLGTLSGGKRLISSTATFRTEPYAS